MPGYSYLDRSEQVELLSIFTRTKDAIGQVCAWEYKGEQEVNFRGQRLVVYRTYQVGKDLIDLYVAKREGV